MSACVTNLLHCLIGIVNREDHDLGLRIMPEDLPDRSKTVQHRHIDVEDYQVRTKLFCLLDRVLAVYCFAANLQVRLGLKSISDAAAKHFVIVRDKNPQAIIGTSGMLLIPSERH